MENITEQLEWQALEVHQQEIAHQHMREWFLKDPERFKKFSRKFGEVLLDFSRNHIQSETLTLLTNLAEKANLKSHINAFFSGFSINQTENRPALHTALRYPEEKSLHVNGADITSQILAVRKKMQRFVADIHHGSWLGATGKSIQHVVNIGIGGSHHGPLMGTRALKDFAKTNLNFHFISTVDPAHVHDVLDAIDVERTIFIISSKSFTTIETLTNAKAIINSICHQLPHDFIAKHFFAVTAAPKKAIEFGIFEENIFKIWDWVGGRYSIWSAIGLPIMLMIGAEQFDEFLSGAYEVDQHFYHAPLLDNLPVLLGLLGVWYNNFYHTRAQAIIPYSHRLRHLIPYLQQADMESNGKSVNKLGQKINYRTSPIIFGEEGCDGQHTYHQWLHQGPDFIPVDFIIIGKPATDISADQHKLLIASALSQAEALMRGKSIDEILNEFKAANIDTHHANALAQHKAIPGNRPSNIIFLERLNPKNLGALLALYEHKIFVQGVIWSVNSFDQWGVELGKQLLPKIIQRIQTDNENFDIDCATDGLIKIFNDLQGRA